MGRALLGLLKGGVIGALVGALALKLGVAGGPAAAVTYAVIGGLAGIVCGRPPWRQDTTWTSALKGLVGVGVGIGLYFLSRKLLGGAHLASASKLVGAAADRPLVELPILLGPVVGALWGIFVEVDDSPGPAKSPDKTADKKKPA
jgi:hypothetical protein